MEITTRRATTFDAVTILQLLVAMHDEAEAPLSSIHAPKALAAINEAIANGYVEVALQGDYIVGAIGSLVYCDWWSLDERVADLFFYVAPECRASKAAVLLLKKVIEVTGEAEATLKVGTATGEALDRKDEFFTRHGFVKGGSHYILER